jgi:DNA repair exonuclease SbcCD ATPase subunit
MEHLRRRLAELHAELERTDALDGESRAALEEVLRDIQELLARSDEEQREPASLAERLREASRHFEDSHPTLTATLGRVVDALVALGI